ILLVGLGRFGAELAALLRERGCRLLAVDIDPDIVTEHLRDGYRVQYGDAEDPEFLASLPLERIRWVVSSVRERGVTRLLLDVLRKQGYRGKIAVVGSS